MTKPEIERLLNLSVSTVNQLFIDAGRENGAIKYKLDHTSGSFIADFTLDEVIYAMSLRKRSDNEVERFIIKEGFIDHGNKPVPKGKVPSLEPIDGTEEFLKAVSRYPKKRCCATCSFVTSKTKKNSKPVYKPYCKLYGRFLFRMKANPYKSWCDSWEYSGKKAMVWYKSGRPDDGKLLGYDRSVFKSVDRSDGRLVNEVGISGSLLS